MIIAIITKKILIGTYKAGCYPVWGSMYLRNWIAMQTVRLVPLNIVEGTEFKNMFLRFLGVKIGKNSYIQKSANVIMGGWDLLEIGDNVTIGRGAATRTMTLHNGELIFDKINIADGATLETRASMSPGTKMESDSLLTGLSMIPSGVVIPNGEVWEGVPASFIKESEPPPKINDKDDIMSPYSHGLYLIFMRTAMGFITTLPLFIGSLVAVIFYDINDQTLLNWFFSTTYTSSIIIKICIFMIIAPLLSLPLQALYCRLLKK